MSSIEIVQGKIAAWLPMIVLLLVTALLPAATVLADPLDGALDAAGKLPGESQRSERSSRQPSAVETLASSVRALGDVMKQAIDVAAMLPADQRQTVNLFSAPAQNLSKIDFALEAASRLPRPAPGEKAAMKAKGPPSFSWPVEGLIYSTFNATRGRNRRHGAIDIVAPRGTPIASVADGRVSVAANGGRMFSGYGKIVIVDHGNGFHTVYAHCDRILVKMGQQVRQGEFIATVGRTGRATTDHVHFEVRVAGKRYDPLKYLPDRPEMVKAHNWKSGTKKINR